MHRTLRVTLRELCERHGDWSKVVEYLAKHGGRYDQTFFAYWRKHPGTLSAKVAAKMLESPSPWIRVYCLETFGHMFGPTRIRNVTGSMQVELKELQERVGRLREAQKHETK